MRGVLIVLMLALVGTIIRAIPDEQTNEAQLVLLQTRQDLEFLANDVLGEGVRPESWTFNSDLQSNTVVSDLWFDNEQLADAVFGEGIRPEGWFGATSRIGELIIRNVRHDLELTADEVFGAGRPAEWSGAAARFRCDRTIQNALRILTTFYDLEASTPNDVGNYCDVVAREVSGELLPQVYLQSPNASEGLEELSLALRGDLERLSNEMLGLDTRPDGWIGFVEDSETLLRDSVADIELLAETQFANRAAFPEDWQPSLSVSDNVLLQNQRYNLELLADLALDGGRPNGWQGENPLERCLPLEQGFIFMVQDNYTFDIPEASLESSNACDLVIFDANTFVENPEAEAVVEAQEDTRFIAEAEYAFAYLDAAATEYMGIVPAGTQFRAWYRNFSGSSMMFVSGENFAVFIDRRWTTFSEEIYNTLPTLEGVAPLAFCDASWCNGPGPTPTPTGSGPLVALLNNTTPQPTIDPGNVQGEGGTKTQVSWNHIRVQYLLDRPETGTVQVALEICAEPTQVTCEPVIAVFDNNLGTQKPVLSQFNGLNVYEFRYGYNNNVIVEGATYVSPDIWISDPSIR